MFVTVNRRATSRRRCPRFRALAGAAGRSRIAGGGGLTGEGPRWAALVLMVWMVVMVVAGGLTGGAATWRDREYLIDAWETDQGLPENSATAAVQTPDGYLWFGTFAGLVRYDGTAFTAFDPALLPGLPSGAVVNLHLDRQRRLWVSTLRGLVVSLPGEWTTLQPVTAWTGDYVRTFSEGAGVLCATSFDGMVLRVEGDRMEVLPRPPGIAGSGYLGHVDAQGGILVGQPKSGVFARWDGRDWTEEPPAPGVSGGVTALGSSVDGGLLVLSGKELIEVRDGQVARRVTLRRERAPAAVWSLYRDSAGQVWIAGEGLLRVGDSGEVRQFTAGNGLTYDDVRFAFEDRERNLWVGTDGGGLLRFKARRFLGVEESDGLRPRNARALLEEEPGRMLIGTYGGGLYRWEAGRTSPVEEALKASTPFVQALCRDREQQLWIGGYTGAPDGRPLARMGVSGRVEMALAEAGGASVRAIFEDSRGGVWVGGGRTVARWEGGRLRLEEGVGAVALGDVRCFAEDPRTGEIWAAGGEGLVRRTAAGWRSVRRGDGTMLRDLAFLRFEPDGTLWLGGTGTGLIRHKEGAWSVIAQGQGLPAQDLTCLLDDGLGYAWMGSNRGVIRASRPELEEAADGRLSRVNCQLFGLGDGLATGECTMGYQSAALKDSLGRLWFATVKGVAMVDPGQLRLNTNPPPVQLESVSYLGRDGRRAVLAPGRPTVSGLHGPFHIPAGGSDLQARFAVLSFAAPERVRMRYALYHAGRRILADEGSHRTPSLQWLPPGTYELRVSACNNDGVWNQDAVALGFVMHPFVWQTGWFRGLSAAVLLGGVALGLNRRHRRRLRRTEQQLREQEVLAAERARAAALTQFASDVVVSLDAGGRFTYASASASRVLGQDPDALRDASFFDFVHPEDEPGVKEAFSRMPGGASGGAPVTFRMRHARGHWVWIEAVGSNLLEQPGVRGVLVTARDITERRRAEEAERDRHERIERQQQAILTLATHEAFIGGEAETALRVLTEVVAQAVQASRVSVWQLEDDDACLRCLDLYLASEFLHQHGQVLSTAAYRAYFAALAQGRAVDAPDARQDARTRELAESYLAAADIRSMLDAAVRLHGRVVGVVCIEQTGAVRSWQPDEVGFAGEVADAVAQVLINVERKEAVLALRESEERFRNLAFASLDGMMVHERGLILDANPAFARLFGYDRPEALRGIVASRLLVPAGAPVDRSLWWEEDRPGPEEVTGVRKDGSRFVAETDSRPLKYFGREARIVSCRDIDARKRAEAALRESEERYRALFDRSRDWVFLVDFEGRFLDANPAALEALGLDRASLGEPTFASLLDDGQLPLAHRTVQEVLATGHQQGPVEFRVRTADGRILFVEVQSSLLYRQGRPAAIQGIARDVTGRKRAEEERTRLQDQLIQSQKMEAVGQLAGGVAHDFNNILAAMMMHLGLLRARPGLTPETRLELAELQACAERAANLTRQLLLFGRRQVMQPQLLEIDALLGNLLKMLRRLIGEKYSLELRGPSAPLLVFADAGMLDQIVMNLVVNARDAMPDGGRITLLTEAVDIDARAPLRHPDARPGRFVCLTVSDTGLGMDAVTLKHLFEPFYTTKQAGKGTGLGLATVYGIVKRHEGWVEVESAPGRGTSFHVFLPARAVGEESPPAPPSPAVLTGDECVLVVEDDPAVRARVVEALVGAGYRVLAAGGVREAQRIWAQVGSTVDLVLTDMVLPDGLSGLELATDLRRERPGLKVILMSGYSHALSEQGLPDAGEVVYLAKPFELQALTRAVRDCLNGSRAPSPGRTPASS